MSHYHFDWVSQQHRDYDDQSLWRKISRGAGKHRDKQANSLKRGKGPDKVAVALLGICWESGASFLKQSQKERSNLKTIRFAIFWRMIKNCPACPRLRGGGGGVTIRPAKRDIPVFQTGYTGTREYEDHVQHKWRAVPQAACSSSVLSLRMKPHWQWESQIPCKAHGQISFLSLRTCHETCYAKAPNALQKMELDIKKTTTTKNLTFASLLPVFFKWHLISVNVFGTKLKDGLSILYLIPHLLKWNRCHSYIAP